LRVPGFSGTIVPACGKVGEWGLVSGKKKGIIMLIEYIPILILFVIATLFAVISVILSYMVGQHKPNPAKMSAYECGIVPLTEAAGPYPVKFYVTAMLFILFDIEVLFFYPWAVAFRQLSRFYMFAEMLIFVVILFVGYVYVWKRGAFEWEEGGEIDG
jgi:NADH-quinone oxidoreductase subunit A